MPARSVRVPPAWLPALQPAGRGTGSGLGRAAGLLSLERGRRSGAGPASLGAGCVTAPSPRLRLPPPPPRRVLGRFSHGRWVWGAETCPLSGPACSSNVCRHLFPAAYALSPLLDKGNSSGVCSLSDPGECSQGGRG